MLDRRASLHPRRDPSDDVCVILAVNFHMESEAVGLWSIALETQDRAGQGAEIQSPAGGGQGVPGGGRLEIDA